MNAFLCHGSGLNDWYEENELYGAIETFVHLSFEVAIRTKVISTTWKKNSAVDITN